MKGWKVLLPHLNGEFIVVAGEDIVKVIQTILPIAIQTAPIWLPLVLAGKEGPAASTPTPG